MSSNGNEEDTSITAVQRVLGDPIFIELSDNTWIISIQAAVLLAS